ncbi:fatty acid desaturase, partial [Bacteriovoracaceae bacterium]|nr:fatty acid desaturase [Bacteriovoracaceae bacterium]
GMAFMAHEILHGSVVKSKKVQDWLGFLGFAPFMISPTFWKFWHNRLHHGKTQNLAIDPDCFPNLAVYRRSKFMKWAFRYTPGSGYIRSYFYFSFWFMFQAFLSQAYFRFHNKNYKSVDQKKVTLEFAIMIVIFLVYAQFVGMGNWMYLLVIPFMVQNYTVMSYISTNHNLNPLTKVNDPLVNSLTVTNNSFWEFIHLNFGYHTEHHIFPRMSGQYVKIVSEQLKKQFPERYNIMPKSEALKKLYSTPRVYKDKNTLIHPETHHTVGTIVEVE